MVELKQVGIRENLIPCWHLTGVFVSVVSILYLGTAEEMVIKGGFICSHLAFVIDTAVLQWDMHSESVIES